MTDETIAGITKTRTRYELLVRFAEDGSIQGAHQRFMTVIRDGDEVLSTKEDVEPLDPSLVDDVLSAETGEVLAQADAAIQANREMTAALIEAEKLAKEATDERDELAASITEIRTERDALKAELAGTVETLRQFRYDLGNANAATAG